MLTINNTLDGYLKDVEIKGNTVQDPDNLADIRSVGDKVEGQELYEIPVLSVGKNLWNYGDTKFVPKNADRWCNFEGTNELMYGDMTDKTSVKIHIKEGNYYVTYDADNSKNVKGVQLVEIQEKATYSILNNVLSLQEGVYTVRIKNELVTEVVLKDFMICASDVATPYEPYIEDKLTILSLVQLEKVGDVRDRIVCKDGVWGVEKNVITKLFDGSENNVTGVSLDGNGLNYRLCYSRKKVLDNVADSSKLMSNKFECFVYSSSTNNVTVPSFRFIYTNSELYCVVPATEFTEHPSTQAFKEKVASYGTYIKYPTTQPQFIPLPHDQQVKLRTFANKTNISFLTEIEGTIKAQVPKSLGATVNTHTEQINNLNKELDRVKKLEESTVSTVTTESDFTTVEATSNGYFEDVKLEGKTLVNLATQPTNNGSVNHQYATISTVTNIKPSTEYTYIIRNNGSETLKLYLNHNGGFDWFDLDVEANSTVIGKARSLPTIDGDIWLSLKKAETVEQNLQVVLLEGDHTQNPPSYFEGLKSVGQSATTSEDGADEIVVSSVKGDGNLFDGEFERGSINFNTGICYENNYRIRSKNFNRIIGDCYVTITGELTANPSNAILYYDSSKNYIDRIYLSNLQNIKLPQNAHYFKLAIFEDNGIIVPLDIKISVYKGTTPKQYVPHQSDKKRLLFYNNETQTWEKPILREWDSIEKHADGKYYYHQRSGEDVLNGSEAWNSSTLTASGLEAYAGFGTPIENGKVTLTGSNYVIDTHGFANQELDTINNNGYLSEALTIHVNGNLYIRILKSKLPTQDVQGFKQWLQTNNVTVVYQLAQEKVYECTNIDLITYANETNYVVESGVLSPKTTLKVHSNISNVVSLLQKKVSLLESNMTKYMITQNRLQLSSTYSADSVTFKVDYTVCSENMSQENYDTDLYNLILNNILVGKDNYNYDHMFNIIMDYASWSQISWDQFDILVGLMDIQHNPPIEEIPTDDEIVEEMPNEIM